MVTGYGDDAETMEVHRFLLRNSYPHRMVDVPAEETKPMGGELIAS